MNDQEFDCWYTEYPSTHKYAGMTVQVVTRAQYDEVAGKLESLQRRIVEGLPAALEKLGK